MAKLGSKLFMVFAKVFKSAKVVKIGLAGASVVSYSLLTSWQFALAIMTALFVHESGHVWAMKRKGMKVKGIYFIPFFGAAAVTDQSFKSREDELYIAMMGPVWGFFLAILVGMIYFMTGNPLWAAIASWMALVNLFNLLPINPLDGGRIFKSVTFSFNSSVGLLFLGIGAAVCIYLSIKLKMSLIVFILVIGSLEIFFEWEDRKKVRIPKMNGCGIMWGLASYGVLAAALFYLMSSMNAVPEAKIAMQILMG
jgi:Zn-dependent protease